MIPHTPESSESASIAVFDPMADIASIVDDAGAAGLEPDELAFISVHLTFADREAWEAAQSADASWEVAAYSTDVGHMLRLSRRTHPTARALTKLRADARSFVAANAAEWLSMSIENQQQAPTSWQALTAHDEVSLPEQRALSEVETDMGVQRLRRGGTA